MRGDEPGPEEVDDVLASVRALCLGLPGTDEATLQDRPLFRVGNRRFAIYNGAGFPPRRRWDGRGQSLHFLADPLERDALGQDERFTPSPHHAHRGWMALPLTGDTDWEEVGELLEAAHAQVAPRMRPRPLNGGGLS